jgi:hypothetical protein
MALITDPDDLNQATEITITTGTREFTLNIAGNLSNDGVTLQALYSFFKEEWKSDAALIPHPFPMIAITPEQFEFIEGWNPNNDTTRKLIRTGGWREIGSDLVLDQEWVGVITLGSFVDENATDGDLAYYQQGDDPTDTAAAVDFDFRGPVNEAVQSYNNVTPADATALGFVITANNVITRNDGGNWDTDGYKVGGRVTVQGAEDAANNGTYVIEVVGAGVDGALTVLETGPDAGTGFAFTTSTITRNDGGSWIVDGYHVDGSITVANADTVGNNGTYTITVVTATVITVSGTPLTVDTVDQTATFKPLVNNVDDTTASFAVNDRNVLNVRVRERTSTAVTTARTFDASNLPAIGVTEVDNKVFRFPLANATDLKITETDANIDANIPYTGMSIQYFATPQARNIGGPSFNFGIIINGNNGTAEEIYEFVQRQLRRDADIDSGAGTVVGRTADELLVFVGDTLATGRAIPDNPNGGGSGVYIDNFDANDTNRLIFTDNTGTERTFPFVSAGTISFNNNLVTDTMGHWWMFFEYTIRTNVTDFVLTPIATNNGSINSVGAGLPTLTNTEYIAISGLTGGDAPMNGIYQVNDLTPTTTQTEVDRVDGATIVAVASTTVDIDENPIDSPGALIVDDNSGVPLATQTYVNNGFGISGITGVVGTLDSATTDLTISMVNGDLLVLGDAWLVANQGEWDVTTAPAGAGPWTAGITKRVNTTPANEASVTGGQVTARPVDTATYTFDFDYDGNVQGGRTISTDADIVLRAIGLESAQYVQTTGTIIQAVGQSFSLVSGLERNYSNP